MPPQGEGLHGVLALHPFWVLAGVAATPGFGQFGTEMPVATHGRKQNKKEKHS